MKPYLSLLLALTSLALCGCGGLQGEAYEVEQRRLQIVRGTHGLRYSLSCRATWLCVSRRFNQGGGDYL